MALFGVMPGGMTVLVVLADELNLDTALIAGLQMLRLLTAVLVLPIIFSLLL